MPSACPRARHLTFPRPEKPLSNIHTHGLQVSPSDNADNPFLLFKPGDTFDYEIKLPNDQPAGLHWYHPHRHGSAAKQGWAGLGGAIVVEGAIDKVPEVAAAPERLMLLQEIWGDRDGHVPVNMAIPAAMVHVIGERPGISNIADTALDPVLAAQQTVALLGKPLRLS